VFLSLRLNFYSRVVKILVKIWKWNFRNFRYLNHQKNSNFTSLHLICVKILIFLNTAEYTKRLMICQTFIILPSIERLLLCCADKQCGVTVYCVGLENWHPVISGSFVLTQAYLLCVTLLLRLEFLWQRNENFILRLPPPSDFDPTYLGI
jgi:hypothetical protein